VRLVGKHMLQRLVDEQPTTRPWVSSWAAEIEEAQWKSSSDLLAQFPRVRAQNDGGFYFPVAGTKTDVVLSVAFPAGIALIKEFIPRDESNGR